MSHGDTPELFFITYDSFLDDVRLLGRNVAENNWLPDFVVGIGRGGLVPAVYISHQLNLPMLSIDHSSHVAGFADDLLAKVAIKSASGTRLLFIDDINDSGGTMAYIRQVLIDSGCENANLRFAVIINNERSKMNVDYSAQTIDRHLDKRWFVFPWESVGTGETIIAEALSVSGRLA